MSFRESEKRGEISKCVISRILGEKRILPPFFLSNIDSGALFDGTEANSVMQRSAISQI